MTSWFWPASGSARAIGLVPYANGMAVADWVFEKLWPFTNAFGTPITLASGTPGLCGIAADNASGAWALTYSGGLFHVTSGGAVTLATTLPSGQVYVGLTFGGPSGYPYAVASNGNFYGYPGVPVSGAFNTGCWFAANSPTILYTLCPALSGVGTAPFNSAPTGLISLPTALTVPSVLLYSGGLAVGGWQYAPALFGGTAAALNPNAPIYMIGVGSGAVTLWSAPAQYADAWTQTQQVTGAFSFTSVAWRPDGTQFLAASSSGTVEVFNFTAGVFASGQVVTGVASGVSIAITSDSAHAIVAQSGLSQATPLSYSVGVWSIGVAVTGLPGIVGVAPAGASGAFAAISGGIALLAENAGAWSISASAATSFVPTCLTTDYFGNAYIAGVSGVAQFDPSLNFLASGAWSGAAPTSIAVQQGRIILSEPSTNLLTILGLSSPATFTTQSTKSLTLGSKMNLALSATTLFVLGSGSTKIYGFSGTPFALSEVMSGAVGTYNGSSWTVTPLGIGHAPSAMTYDAAGNLQIATLQNTWWTLTTGAVLTSGIVPVYSGQTQNVPMGPSALLAFSGHLYCGTSLSGVLIELQ